MIRAQGLVFMFR